MENILYVFVIVINLTIVTSQAYAHPGHGILSKWIHLLEPEHVFPILIAVALLIYTLIKRKSRR